jgi:RNAse (barnase) inhibitor barstar
MKMLATTLCLLFAFSISRADDNHPDLKALRKQLIIAIDNSNTTDSLFKALSKQVQKTPLTIAYIGALGALKAKHAWNPYNKIKYLNISEKEMQQALDQDPHNIEILFMRFSIQHNLPGFLGYGKNLTADRQEMITQLNRKNYGTADKELTISIIKFLIDSKRCTEAESSKLQKQLAAL